MAKDNREKVIDLGFKPRPWQQYCIDNWRRFNVVVLHRQGGKSELACMQLIRCAVACKLPMGRFAYIAPELGQAKRDMWDRLKNRLAPLAEAGGVEWSDSELWVKFLSNGAKIRLYGAKDPDTLRGGTLDGVVFDETAQIDPMVWDAIIEPMLMARHGFAIFIGTPQGINLLSVLYERAQRDPAWFCKRWTVYETNSLSPEEIERKKQSSGPNIFAREFLCDFSATGDDQLIGLQAVEDASRRAHTDRDVEGMPRILGVDPARFGDDRSVICKRQGLQMFDPLVFQGLSNMDLASRVANVIEEWRPNAVFIDAGAGSGVIDRLRQLGYDVIEVPFGGKAILDKLYVNRRTEMWFGIKQWIEGGGAIPNDSALKQELATPIFWFDPSGRKALESKDDIKKRLQGASPDIADALALTFAHPVHVPDAYEQTEQQLRQRRRSIPRKPYDPLVDDRSYNMFADL